MSQICSKTVTFLFSAYFAANFFTIATVNVNLISDFYTWAIVLIKIKIDKDKEALFNVAYNVTDNISS